MMIMFNERHTDAHAKIISADDQQYFRKTLARALRHGKYQQLEGGFITEISYFPGFKVCLTAAAGLNVPLFYGNGLTTLDLLNIDSYEIDRILKKLLNQYYGLTHDQYQLWMKWNDEGFDFVRCAALIEYGADIHVE